MPQFDVSTYPSLLFWLVLTFVTLYGVLAKVILPRITGALSVRDQHLQRLEDQTQALDRETQRLEQESRQALDAARHEAHALMQAAQDRLAADLADQTQAWQANLDARLKTLTAELDQHQQILLESFAAQLPTLTPKLAQAVTHVNAPNVPQEGA